MTMPDRWQSGVAYERFMGRWSRMVASRFVDWLGVAPGGAWLDVGCGSGALIAAVAARAAPGRLVAVDPSPGFAAHVGSGSDRVGAAVARAESLPFPARAVDVAVAGLVLNFTSDPLSAVVEMARCARVAVGVYVWDYGGEVGPLRAFWRAAAALDPAAAALDEGARFASLCRPSALRGLFVNAGMRDVVVEPIDIAMRYAGVEECWTSFLGGQGPAPTYCASLAPEPRAALRVAFIRELGSGPGGPVALPARAWAAKGSVFPQGVSGQYRLVR